MSRFEGLLKQINGKLDLPQPTKSRILLEIASDLDDMYRVFIQQGMSEQDAAERGGTHGNSSICPAIRC
ncbi:MAG: hypothetical protein ABIA59_00965 [Candidatus Latescibacterota bacterium]